MWERPEFIVFVVKNYKNLKKLKKLSIIDFIMLVLIFRISSKDDIKNEDIRDFIAKELRITISNYRNKISNFKRKGIVKTNKGILSIDDRYIKYVADTDNEASRWNCVTIMKSDCEAIRSLKGKSLLEKLVILRAIEDTKKLNLPYLKYLIKKWLINRKDQLETVNNFLKSNKIKWPITQSLTLIRSNQALKSKSSQIKDIIIKERSNYQNKPWYKQYQDLWDKLEQQITEIIKYNKADLIARVIKGYFKKVLELKNSYWTNYNSSSERWLCGVVRLDYIEKHFNN